MKKIIWIALLMLSTSTSLAQTTGDACPAIVQKAIESIDEFCADTGRNEACYGHPDMEVVPQPGVTEFVFNQSGDRIQLTDLDSLTLNAMDEENEVWGAILMRLQANIPNTLPGENVTMLFFGDTEISNEVPLDNEDGVPPMQSFIFKSGIGDSKCEEAPDSGFLIQTPEGIGLISLTINGIDVEVGSTVYVNQQNQFERELEREVCFATLEGAALLTVDDNSRDVQEGTVSCVPINTETLQAAGPPSAPAPIPDQMLNQVTFVADTVFDLDVNDTQQATSDYASGRLHTIQTGETFYAIAQCYGISVAELQAANQLEDYRLIYVGQQLIIPGTDDFARLNWICRQPVSVPSSITPTSSDGVVDTIIVITPGPFFTPTVPVVCIIPQVGTYNLFMGGSPYGTMDITSADANAVTTPGGFIPGMTLTRNTALESDCSQNVVYTGSGWTLTFNSPTTFTGTDGTYTVTASP